MRVIGGAGIEDLLDFGGPLGRGRDRDVGMVLRLVWHCTNLD